jgi:hypothetical protein
MHHQVLVGILHGQTHSAEQAEPFFDGEPVGITVFVDRLSLDQLHDHIRKPVLGCPAVQQTGDVGMLQVGQNLAFGAKAS